MEIDNVFEIGDVVYLRIREEKMKGMVTELSVKGPQSLMYQVTWEDQDVGETWHISHELTTVYTPTYD